MNSLFTVGLQNASIACILAVIVWLVTIRARRPAIAHGLWLVVLLNLVIPPLVASNLQISSAWIPTWLKDGTVNYANTASTGLHPSLGQLDAASEGRVAVKDASRVSKDARSSWTADAPTVVSTIWGVGSLCWFLAFFMSAKRFGGIVAVATVAPDHLRRTAAHIAKELGLTFKSVVKVTDACISPMVWSFGTTPTLLLPRRLLVRLTDAQVAALLTHEIAHLRRRDHWTRWLEAIALGLYWWHPVAWFTHRKVRQFEDECCDAWVLSTIPGIAKSYAETLLETVDFISSQRNPVPILGTAFSGFRVLRCRIDRIQRNSTDRHMTAIGLLAVLVVAAFTVPLSTRLTFAHEHRDKERHDNTHIHNDQEHGDVHGNHPHDEHTNATSKPHRHPSLERMRKLVKELPESPRLDRAATADAEVFLLWAALATEDKVKLSIAVPTVGDVHLLYSSTLSRNGLRGLSFDDEVADFKLVRDAGTFHMRGTVEDGIASGHVVFVARRVYLEEMKELGYPSLTTEEVMQMAFLDVSSTRVRRLVGRSTDSISSKRLVTLAMHGVTPDYMDRFERLGYGQLSLDDALKLRVAGVTPGLVDQFSKLGYADLSLNELQDMGLQGVNPKFIRELQELGYENLKLKTLVSMRVHGVSPDFIREVSKGRTDRLSPKKLIERRVSGL